MAIACQVHVVLHVRIAQVDTGSEVRGPMRQSTWRVAERHQLNPGFMHGIRNTQNGPEALANVLADLEDVPSPRFRLGQVAGAVELGARYVSERDEQRQTYQLQNLLQRVQIALIRCDQVEAEFNQRLARDLRIRQMHFPQRDEHDEHDIEMQADLFRIRPERGRCRHQCIRSVNGGDSAAQILQDAVVRAAIYDLPGNTARIAQTFRSGGFRRQLPANEQRQEDVARIQPLQLVLAVDVLQNAIQVKALVQFRDQPSAVDQVDRFRQGEHLADLLGDLIPVGAREQAPGAAVQRRQRRRPAAQRRPRRDPHRQLRPDPIRHDPTRNGNDVAQCDT